MITKLNQIIATIFCFYGSFLFSQTTTITLDVSSTVGDAQIRSGSTSTNYGTLNNSNVSVASTTDRFRFLIHFDLSSIPSNAIISVANLQLTPTAIGENGATNSSFVASARTASWVESTVNYTTGSSTITANQQTASTLVSGKRTFDLKNMIQAHVNGTQLITGISIRRNPESTVTGACQYHTKESSTSTSRPKLIITYYIPFNITAATITKATTTSATNGSIAPTITGGSGTTQFQWINSAGTQIATTQNLTSRTFGWYGLRLTGSLGDVYYMAFLIGVTCEPVTINFRQDPNFIDDANLASNASPATTNFGTNDFMRFGFDDPNVRTSLLRYRLWIDPNNEFTDAKLYLFGKAHTTTVNTSTISRLTSTWAELGVNNTSIPTFSTDMNITIPTTTSTTQNQVINVTDYFRFWTLNSSLYHGFRFSGPGTGFQDYHSSDATTSTNRPYVSFIVEDKTCEKRSFTELKNELDGSFVKTLNGTLQFYFIEEYKIQSGKYLDFKIINQTNNVLLSVSMTGTLSNPSYTDLLKPYVFDDNFVTLNLAGKGLVSGQFYTLELTTSTNEKRYLKFQFN
jgi:hypothetical protein